MTLTRKCVTASRKLTQQLIVILQEALSKFRRENLNRKLYPPENESNTHRL